MLPTADLRQALLAERNAAFLRLRGGYPMPLAAAIAAYWTYRQLVPLILAVGMAGAWPVIGWTYGRTTLFTTHALVRAVVCFILWNWFPAIRFTLLPFSVAVIYLATIAVILVATSQARSTSAWTEAVN